jgi:cytochrome c oxidase subunit 2
VIFRDKGWIFIILIVAIFVLAACAAADDEATPTPASSIQDLPLPTDSPDEIVAVIVTPTPSAAGAEGNAETTAQVTEQPPAEGEEATPTGAATESVEAETTTQPTDQSEETAEPTGEATEQPATNEPTGEATEQASAAGGDGEMASLNEEELVNRGEEIYATQCAKCHQLNGQGMGDAFPALEGSEIVTAEDPSAVVDTVLHGPEAMPSFENVLSAQEIAAVVSYIRNAWDNNASAVNTQEVQEVQETGGAGGETAQN